MSRRTLATLNLTTLNLNTLATMSRSIPATLNLITLSLNTPVILKLVTHLHRFTIWKSTQATHRIHLTLNINWYPPQDQR